MCISLVAGWCTFPVHGAGAVGTGSVFACCGSAAVSSVLFDMHVSRSGALLGGTKLNFSPSFQCQDSVGEPLYMLFRGIKHQVDKGPVDWVTGKAKYTLNDNRLLREDLEYRTLVSTKSSVLSGRQG